MNFDSSSKKNVKTYNSEKRMVTVTTGSKLDNHTSWNHEVEVTYFKIYLTE